MTSNATKKNLSQYDGMETLRSVHQDENQAFRTTSGNTSVPPLYSRVELTYDLQGSVENAKFYKGTLSENRRIKVTADSSGSLNNTYFDLYDTDDTARYIIWFNVNGSGTDPAIADTTSIEIPLITDESAEMVAIALNIALSKLSCFKVTILGNQITINNLKEGTATSTTDFGTGFEITADQVGTEKLIKSIDLNSIPGSKYIYNEQEKRFEVISTGGTIDPEGSLIVTEAPDTVGIFTVLSVTNTASAMRIGVANLEGRRSITIQPKGGTIYIGYDNTVTAGNSGTGIKLSSGSVFTVPKGEDVTVYAIKSGAGSVNVFVSEDK